MRDGDEVRWRWWYSNTCRALNCEGTGRWSTWSFFGNLWICLWQSLPLKVSKWYKERTFSLSASLVGTNNKNKLSCYVVTISICKQLASRSTGIKCLLNCLIAFHRQRRLGVKFTAYYFFLYERSSWNYNSIFSSSPRLIAQFNGFAMWWETLPFYSHLLLHATLARCQIDNFI